MPRWERYTPWRQGQLLTTAAIAAFNLTSDANRDDVAAIVISHDCDLAQLPSSEPSVELIVGRFINNVNGTYTHCKNLRCLHLECTAGLTARSVELLVLGRSSIPKESDSAPALANFQPRPDVVMTYRERRILQRWLAARYDRPAFPDEFDRRLKHEVDVHDRLAAVFKTTGNHIPAIFFDVDAGEENVRAGPDDLYELYVTLVYSTHADPPTAEAAAKQAGARIRDMFNSRCKIRNKEGVEIWQWIELAGLEVISDEALTFAQSQLLVKWHADHISLKADPLQPMIAG